MRSFYTPVTVQITADECLRIMTLISNEMWRVRGLLSYKELHDYDNKGKRPRAIQEWHDLREKLNDSLTHAWEEADKDGSDTTGQGDPGSDQKGD